MHDSDNGTHALSRSQTRGFHRAYTLGRVYCHQANRTHGPLCQHLCLARYATMAIKRLQYVAVNGRDVASTWMDPLRSFLAVPQNVPVGSTLCGPKMAWVSLVVLSTVSLILHRSITRDSACAPPIHGSTGKFGVLTICKLEVAAYHKVRDSR